MADELENIQLRDFYVTVVEEFIATGGKVKNSCVGPFLISCPDSYCRVECKWIYVGQETNGWATLQTPDDVRSLMDFYKEFNLAKDYPRKGAPFWSFAHRLDSRMNPQGPERSFIWSNIARLGFANNAGRVSQSDLEFWSGKRLLATEIKVLSPRAVIFATGPRYDDLVRAEFDGIDLPEISKDKPIARIAHVDLPSLSFRMYHPAFLRRNKLEELVADIIVKAVSTDCPRDLLPKKEINH